HAQAEIHFHALAPLLRIGPPMYAPGGAFRLQLLQVAPDCSGVGAQLLGEFTYVDVALLQKQLADALPPYQPVRPSTIELVQHGRSACRIRPLTSVSYYNYGDLFTRSPWFV